MSARKTKAQLETEAREAQAKLAKIEMIIYELVWPMIKSEVEELIEEEVSSAVDDLQVSR